VYYQVYKDNVGIKSKQPHPDDPYVGHISVDFVSPPHTAKSIILCISKSEDIHDCTQSQLFTGISSDSSIGEGHVSIFTSDRPGSTPEDPLAFVTVDLPFAKFTKRMRVTCAFSQLKLEWLRNHYTHLLYSPQQLSAVSDSHKG
jgi:hypothetical protein